MNPPYPHNIQIPHSPQPPPKKPTWKVQKVGQIWWSNMPKVGQTVMLLAVTVKLLVLTVVLVVVMVILVSNEELMHVYRCGQLALGRVAAALYVCVCECVCV